MALNSYQKISRVLPGLPFGTGADGDLTISSDTTQSVANTTCSGTVSTTTLLLGSASTFANGDIILIHITRQSGAGAWEVNRIISGGGTTTLTLQSALATTYPSGGTGKSQVYKIMNYYNVTINTTKTLSGIDWNGDTGGILALAVRGTLTVNGTIELNGGAGSVGGNGAAGGSGGGFRGGQASHANPSQAFCGEGTAGTTAAQNSANGNGGGGANTSGASVGMGGGGGGNGLSGTSSDGVGGTTAGDSELTSISLGGGGGGGANDGTESAGTNPVGGGGSGGGIIILFAKNIAEITGGIQVNGGSGGDASPAGEGGDGGGGSGGSVLIETQLASLGTNKITATGGTGNTNGGSGSVGRIAVHYSSTSTSGTTNPTYNQTFDGSLLETSGGLMFFA